MGVREGGPIFSTPGHLQAVTVARLSLRHGHVECDATQIAGRHHEEQRRRRNCVAGEVNVLRDTANKIWKSKSVVSFCLPVCYPKT